MRAAMEPSPATGKKKPPKSALDVATRLAVLTADSMTDPSTIMLGAIGVLRTEADGLVGNVTRKTMVR